VTEDADHSPDDEPRAEPWVQGWERRWESIFGIEELVQAEADRQPIDEYLWNLMRHLRRLQGQTRLRIDSNYPDDSEALGVEGRDIVLEALDHMADARELVIEAVGEERIEELEREHFRRIMPLGTAGLDEDAGTEDPEDTDT